MTDENPTGKKDFDLILHLKTELFVFDTFIPGESINTPGVGKNPAT